MKTSASGVICVMKDAALAPKPYAALTEKLLWFAGRFLYLIPSNTRIPVPFGINRGLLWIRGFANAPEWFGIYEYRKQRVLRRIVSRGATVCDIGANAGFYTLGMSRMVGEHGRVISFEPVPANLNKIRRHLAINKIDNVTLSGSALSDKSGSVAFALGDSDFTGRISEDACNTFEVPAISLDDFISQNAIVDPTFLKIDVEGAEANVLTGAHELIARTHPTMLIALHGRQAAANCYSVLREAGYVMTTLCGVEIKSAESIPADILAIYGGPIRPGTELSAKESSFPHSGARGKTMSGGFYRVGIHCLQWLGSFELVSRLIDHFCKVWQRHRKLGSHLRAQNFDGVIDGGANIGEFAQIVRAALPQAHLICAEPHPACATALRKGGFQVVEAALWNEPTRLRLTQPTSASTSSTVIADHGPAEHVWEVAAMRLDSLPISGSRLLIKLDLQGAEFEALEGMGKLWDRCAGILLEVSIGVDGTHERLREMLSRRGFYEYSTTNELEVEGRVVEADKLWLRR